MIIDGNNIEVVIEKKRMKNIYFRVKEDGKIYVTCPKLVSDLEIRKMLKQNEDSLTKMYRKSVKRVEKKDKIFYLGKELDFIEYKKVMITDDQAYGPSVDAVNEYLKKHCMPIFQSRMDVYTPEFKNLPDFRLRSRLMKTRWGVCNKKSMTVTLNSELIHKNVHLIDYVICHELSHFDHMDHSTAFWNEVSKHYPDYKKARKELRD